MKNYTVSKVLSDLNGFGGVSIEGKKITVSENSGLGKNSWGKVDFLTNHNGYTLSIVKAGR